MALVDDEDREWLSQYKWHTCVAGADCWRAQTKRGEKAIYMHRLILDAPGDMEVDHINHNPLDNRRSNIRLCTRSQQNQNRRKVASVSSRYAGVHWDKDNARWRAQIQVRRKIKCLGRFIDEEDAADAYNKAAEKYYGEFAQLNEIPDA